MYTQHGHYIPGSATGDGPHPVNQNDCGGPLLCGICKAEADDVMKFEISTDIIDLDVSGMFASSDKKVINWEGENYYRACGELVVEKPEGGSTSCILPVSHRHWDHRDWNGTVRSDFGYVEDIPAQIRDFARKVLLRTGLDEEQVYNALNALLYAQIKIDKEPTR